MIFDLVNPPSDEHIDVVMDTLQRIDFPWLWVMPELVRAGRDKVKVRWEDQRQGVTGTYWSAKDEIQIKPGSPTFMEKGLAFTFAHEAGHLVDDAVLSYQQMQDIMNLLHDSEETYRRDEQYLNDEIIEYAHVHEHSERWSAPQPHYYFKLNESFADLFVMAFAPSVWNGESPWNGKEYPRFTHWTSDAQAVRDIVLSRRPSMFEDVDEDNPFSDDIEDIAALGISRGYEDGTFRPGEPVTRGAMAAFLARTLDHVDPDWRQGLS